LKELAGVHPDLVAVVKRAIEITIQDFSVHDGLRTPEEQRKLVKAKASRTQNSRHLTGHAVDLVPYVNGKLRWELDLTYSIADAVRVAAKELGIPIIWGGAWNVLLTAQDDPPGDLVEDYVASRKREGKQSFIDGPHFELPRNLYPM